MSDIQRWAPTLLINEEGTEACAGLEENRAGRCVLFTDHEKIVNRVCRWKLAVGTHQIYNVGCRKEQILMGGGTGGYCPACGGTVEVV